MKRAEAFAGIALSFPCTLLESPAIVITDTSFITTTRHTHTYQPTNFNLLAMIIEIVLLEMNNYTKRCNSFSTGIPALWPLNASKPAAGAVAAGRRNGRCERRF